ncbi:hypothetical protein OGAPHI_001818 [Ogataea philodendri]|uniref:Mitochondrial escape protein 2 n=1 Tax=Ogataea philodendri TaxID=1378263 RepID=A0A9P8PAS8_9ASCO|nr:uncharacterized protein OGAPHI_001818 [Ogataea philodendri]KAH3668064.1 hypothetical protein OGAPHI_001818 [Ogataea philodendri]
MLLRQLIGRPFRLSKVNSPWKTSLSQFRFISEEAILHQSNAGEDDDVTNTGVMLKENKESMMYFDRITPFKTGKYDIRKRFASLFVDHSDKALKQKVLNLAQNKDAPLPLEIKSFKYIGRDGGAFVKFAVPPEMDTIEFNKQIMENVSDKYNDSILHYFIHTRCFPVKGTPWIEDLRRYPSPRIKLWFEGPPLTQENLYLLLRRYGVINDIIPPPTDSKDPFTLVIYRSIRAAITARHCVTGLRIGDTVVHIQYSPIVKATLIGNFITNHSRIAFPLIFALFATFAVLVFDPIRYFFVSEKITEKYSLEKNQAFQQLSKLFYSTRSRVSSVLSWPAKARSGTTHSFEGMSKELDRLSTEIKRWIDENVNSFIIIQGPRGSGKRHLVEEFVLKDRPNCLYIDCENVIKSRKDQQFLSSFAGELGYFPIFSWLNSVSSFVDLVVQGLTGQKSGLSESKETQVKNILALATTVIRDISLSNYRHTAHEQEEVHLKEEDYLQQNPQEKPVVVIDRFQASRKANDANAFVYRELAEWAANMVSMNIAHVIFITDDVGSLETLSKALPNTLFKRCLLTDASNASVHRLIEEQFSQDDRLVKYLQSEKDTLEKCLEPFGGRILDLQMFIRRMRSGESPEDALNGILTQSIEKLSQLFTGSGSSGYTAAQAWCIIKLLAQNDMVTYNDVASLPMLKTNTFATLQAMENSELITIIRERGLVKEIKPSKPLYHLAFQTMVQEPRIYNSLESDYLLDLIKFHRSRINQFEVELEKYSGIEDYKLFRERLTYLASKIDSSTRSISDCEKKLAQLQK